MKSVSAVEAALMIMLKTKTELLLVLLSSADGQVELGSQRCAR